MTQGQDQETSLIYGKDNFPDFELEVFFLSHCKGTVVFGEWNF